MAENHSRGRTVTRKTGAEASAAVTKEAPQKASRTVSASTSSTSQDKQQGGNRSNGNGNNNGNSNNNSGNRSHNNSRNRNRGNRGHGENGNNRNQAPRGKNISRPHQGKVLQPVDLTAELPRPGKQPQDSLRIVALGGISEIGRNMTVFEYNGKLLIVDAGVLFPTSEEPGVDLILPDLSYLEGKMDKVVALVVTHGHEDHIGGMPWLLKMRPDIPIVTARFTAALIKAKCEEHRLRPEFKIVDESSEVKYGPFNVRFWAVNHSIPDCLGLMITTPAGSIAHTGDIKLDQTPPDNRPTDLPALSRYGDEGIDLFLCDSTNANIPGVSGSEAEIAPTFKRIIRDARQRVIVAAFASNVARIQAVVDAAADAGRKVAFTGRSMVRNMEIAERLGYLTVPNGTVVSLDEASKMAPHKVVLLTTGTQGEPMAALSRMARREHRQIRVRDGDTIVLSSSIVPGNEKAVFKTMNTLAQLGATVITGKTAKVHTSGHGFGGELLFLYNAARPKNVMPVHGEWQHIRANKKLAESTGVNPNHIPLAQNGVVVDLKDGKVSIAGQVPVGKLYVDGGVVGNVGQDTLDERKSLGDDGAVAISVVIDDRTRRPLEVPHVQLSGFSDDTHELAKQIAELVDNISFDRAGRGDQDTYRLALDIKRKVGKLIKDKYRREPVILPTIVPMTTEVVIDVEDDPVETR